jgi:cell division ATPase FtsA
MGAERTGGVSVEQLYQELTDVEASGTDDAGPGHRSEQIVDSVTEQLFPDRSFRFEEELVKNSLDEVLLVLVALRDGETHGKGLMEDLSQLFDARLSPGTVYPRLHELEEADVLEMHELVRTKEYRIDDLQETRDRIESAMTQHLALGFVFYSALEEL